MSGVSFSDIEDAFLFVSSAPYGAHSAYLNAETGRIFYQSEMADIDEIGDEETDWGQMTEIDLSSVFQAAFFARLRRPNTRTCRWSR